MVASAAALLAAHQAGTLGVGLSGGGFILPFTLGVLNMLYIELAVLRHDMPVAGSSAGSICNAFASGLVGMPALRQTAENVANRCRAQGNCFGTLEDIIADEAKALVPPGGSARLNSHGRAYFGVSFPSDDGDGPATFELFNRFDGNDDLLSAVLASTYIPMWSGPGMATKFRGRDAYDGSMAGGLESFLPCPPGVSYCVRISTMPAHANIPEGISKDIIGGGPEAYAKVLNTLISTAAGADLPQTVGGLLQSVVGGGPDGAARVAGRFHQWIDGLMSLQAPGAGGADIW